MDGQYLCNQAITVSYATRTILSRGTPWYSCRDHILPCSVSMWYEWLCNLETQEIFANTCCCLELLIKHQMYFCLCQSSHVAKLGAQSFVIHSAHVVFHVLVGDAECILQSSNPNAQKNWPCTLLPSGPPSLCWTSISWCLTSLTSSTRLWQHGYATSNCKWPYASSPTPFMNDRPPMPALPPQQG
jgi:hypothetical protein